MATLLSLFRGMLVVIACVASVIALVNLYYLVAVPDAGEFARDMRHLTQSAFVAAACGFAAYRLRVRADAAKAGAQALAAIAEAVDAVHDGQPLRADIRLLVPMLILVPVFLAGVAMTIAAVDDGAGKLLIAGVMSLLAAVFIGAMLLSQRRRGLPSLVVDADGIDFAWYGRVPWTDVVGYSRRDFGANDSKSAQLVLLVDRPERWTANTPWYVRRSHGLAASERAAYGTLVIPLKLLDVPAARVMAAVADFRGAVGEPPLRFVYPGMTAENIAEQRGLLERQRVFEAEQREAEAELERRHAELAGDPSTEAATERRRIEEFLAFAAEQRALLRRF